MSGMIRLVILALLISVGLIGYSCTDQADSVDGEGAQQVLRRGNGAEPQTLDPARADDFHSFHILADVYEGLVASAADGSLIPGVAEHWDVSDDGRTMRFTLREDARWSNGDAVVAGDFVRAIRRVVDPATAAPYATLLESIENFGAVRSGSADSSELGVEAVDERTLEIRLDQPTGHFMSILAMAVAYPIHSSVTPDTLGDPETFVGNGAYVLVARQTLGSIRLRRNEHYWDADNVSIPEVEFLPIEDETSEMNMYRAGELDITYTIPPASFGMLKETIPDEVRVAPRLAFYYMAFDLTQPPLDNPALRRALSMAADRRQLVELIGRGEPPAYGFVPTGVANHVAAPYEWQELSDNERIARAREAYAEAGYSDENPLTLKLTYDASSIHETIAVAVSGMWQDALGVVIELDKREFRWMLDIRDQRDEWDIMRFAWLGDYNDPMTFLEIFRSDSPQNLSRYANSDYDELLDQALVELDPARRLELMTEAEQMVLSGYPVAPMYYFVSKHLVSPNVGGFEYNSLDRHPSRFLTLGASD